MPDYDPLSRFELKKLRTFEDWEIAIAQTIPTDGMLDWFEEVLEAHIADGT